MLTLITGLILFLGIHSLPMFQSARAGLVARYGDIPFKLAFTVVSFVGLIMIVVGYGSVRWTEANTQLWLPPTWLGHVATLLMLFAMIALVAAYVPSTIRTRLKHPMLVGIKVWAFAHLLANGDLASALLFGTFLAWAVADRISVKRRGALGPLGATSGGVPGDVVVVVVGVALYVFLLLYGHAWLFGVAPIPALSA
ncbi:MAG: NnrU family protein [Hyphomicrobiaceae bacterium]